MNTLPDKSIAHTTTWYIIGLLMLGTLAGCSMVGVGGGMLIDSTNNKKADTIRSESQKIVLQYSGGQKVKGRYRGLVYYPVSVDSAIRSSGGSLGREEISFPAIGETVVMNRDDAVHRRVGKFVGLKKSGSRYLFMLDPGTGSEFHHIPIDEIESITRTDGETLMNFPGPEGMILLYEAENRFYRAPLSSITHINYRTTNNKIILGVLGLGVDIALVLIASQAVDDMTDIWTDFQPQYLFPPK